MISSELPDVEVGIEVITPELAHEYLEANFTNNRKLTARTVNRYTSLMKNGMWKLSTDAIGFDSTGRMVNGQHRLTAIIESDTSHAFIVVRGLPPENTTVFDLGKRRMMHERLTVAGHEISEHCCAIIRNAMGDYNSKVTGTMKYSDAQTDELVWKHYCKHRAAIDRLANRSRQTSTLVIAAALRMYVHLANPHRVHRGPRFRLEAEITPMRLADQFITIASTGMSPTGTKPEDSAAILLNTLMTQQRAKGLHWTGAANYRTSMNAAYAFALGSQLRTIRQRESDPFVDLKTVAPTMVSEELDEQD